MRIGAMLYSVKDPDYNVEEYRKPRMRSYPLLSITTAIQNNLSWETVRCDCCEHNPEAQIRVGLNFMPFFATAIGRVLLSCKDLEELFPPQRDPDLLDKIIETYNFRPYWVCRRIEIGALPRWLHIYKEKWIHSWKKDITTFEQLTRYALKDSEAPQD